MRKYISLLRPSHWTKNLFVFLPVFFGHQMMNLEALTHALIAFAAFCMAASAVYCLNDVIDVEADRRHPVKCHRPIASGKVSIGMAVALMLILALASVAMCWVLDDMQARIRVAMVCVSYLIMEVAYCFWLKHYAIIDICILSLGFVLRIIMGGVATGIVISHWLIMMTFLLTLFLGIAKRRDDVVKMQATGVAPRHNTHRYNITFINDALNITAAVTLVCYIMYTVSPEVTERFNTRYLYLTSIFVLVGLLRYMQLAVIDNRTGDPVKVLLRDRFTQLILAAWLLSFMLVIYVL